MGLRQGLDDRSHRPGLLLLHRDAGGHDAASRQCAGAGPADFGCRAGPWLALRVRRPACPSGLTHPATDGQAGAKRVPELRQRHPQSSGTRRCTALTATHRRKSSRASSQGDFTATRASKDGCTRILRGILSAVPTSCRVRGSVRPCRPGRGTSKKVRHGARGPVV